MKVWCVFEAGDEVNLLSIWATKELAEAECDLAVDDMMVGGFLEYYAEEWEVQE